MTNELPWDGAHGPRGNLVKKMVGVSHPNDWKELGEEQRGKWLSVRSSATESYLVRVEVTDEGRLICTGLILGGRGRTEVTARGLRRIRLNELLTDWREPSFGFLLDAWRKAGAIGSGMPIVRPGPKGHPLDHYRRVADSYRQAIREAPQAPVKRLSEILQTPTGKPTPEPTIRRWLQRSRALGFLDDFPAQPGALKKPRKRMAPRAGARAV